MVNQLRDPRWGRNEEGYAEDPYLTGAMATAYAGGLRGDHPYLLKTAPTLKHFLGYNNETRRETTSSNLGPRVLHEYELPAFRAPIAAGAAVAVMASYNLVNGRPAHLSPLINAELRGWTEDEVLIVSDAGGTVQPGDDPGLLPRPRGQPRGPRPGRRGQLHRPRRPGRRRPSSGSPRRWTRGLLTEADIDQAARRVLAIRFRLGEFDPVEHNPYAAITEDVINCPAHQGWPARRPVRRSCC